MDAPFEQHALREQTWNRKDDKNQITNYGVTEETRGLEEGLGRNLLAALTTHYASKEIYISANLRSPCWSLLM